MLSPVLVLLLCLSSRAAAQSPSPSVDSGWRRGRATYYGAPQSFAGAFDALRGPGSFGVLTQGSCGFTNQPGDVLPYPADAVAALADAAPDYPGSCGRCYAVRCRSGLVLDNDGAPLDINATDFVYLPSVSRTLTDDSGRQWPGNPAEAQGQLYTECWDESTQVTVRIIDTCPCTQVLPAGAPGVKAGGEIRKQDVCCGGSAGIEHFDLSYFASEKLAHPLYGQMMLEYRPVDCESGAPLPFDPGHIDRSNIYGPNGIQTGWSWMPFGASYQKLIIPGYGPGGTAATCVRVEAGGGLPFQVKQGFLPGYQPFKDVATISFSLRSDAGPGDINSTSTPAGQAPNLKMYVLDDEVKKYCNKELYTGDLNPTPQGGGWYRYTTTLADFECNYDGAMPSDVDRIDFQALQVPGNLPAAFCVAGFTLQQGGT